MRFVLAIYFLIFPFLSSATPLPLNEALSQARSQSPELQKADAAREEARWRKVEAFSTYLPKVQASGTYLLDYKYMFTDIEFGGSPASIPNVVPTTIWNLQAQISLWDGWAGTNRFQSARALSDATNDEYRWAEFKLNRNVTLEYYRALAAQTLKQVAENNLKTLQDHLREVQLFRKSGLSTNYDVLRVEVQVSEAESEVLNAEDNLAVANSHLAEVLGKEDKVEASGKLPELKADLVNGLKDDLQQRLDLQATAEKVDGLNYSAKAASRHWIPKLSAFGIYQYYNNRNDGFDDWDNFRNAYQFGLNLSWDLFDGFASEAKRNEAIQQRVQSEKILRQAQLKGKNDIDRWTRKFKYFCSVYKARTNDVSKSQESVRLAREGRKVGARTNTDLLDAEAELYRAEAGVVTAQLGAVEALINLELSTGQNLYRFE